MASNSSGHAMASAGFDLRSATRESIIKARQEYRSSIFTLKPPHLADTGYLSSKPKFDVFNLLQSFGWDESIFQSYREWRHPNEAIIASDTELSPKNMEVITDIVRYLTLRNILGAHCHCCGAQSLPMYSLIHMFELVRQLDEDLHKELDEIRALLKTKVTGAEFMNQEDSD